MKSKLIISQKLSEKLAATDFNTDKWRDNNISNVEELKSSIIEKINNYNKKLNVLSVIVGETNDSRNMHTSRICDETNDFEVAYVFFISPGSIARNMFLAQQAYSGIHNLFNKFCLNSSSNDLYNKPIYIINTNEQDLQDSKIVTIRGSLNMGFNYIDILNENSFPLYKSIEEYNKDLIELGGNIKNHWFTLDEIEKKIIFHTGKNKLKDGTSDRYEFLSRQFPAIKLACIEKYAYDISEIEENGNNETVNSFINYAKKIYK